MLTGKYRPNQPRVPPIACRRRWHPAPPIQAARGAKECRTGPSPAAKSMRAGASTNRPADIKK